MSKIQFQLLRRSLTHYIILKTFNTERALMKHLKQIGEDAAKQLIVHHIPFDGFEYPATTWI